MKDLGLRAVDAKDRELWRGKFLVKRLSRASVENWRKTVMMMMMINLG